MPGPGSLIASPPDTGYADTGAAGYYYKLSSVDIHGNESGFALLLPVAPTGVGEQPTLELSLAPPWPNPARERVQVGFALPRSTRVSLAIYDVMGRKMRQVADGVLPAGGHVERWDLRDASGSEARAGLYFVRMEAEGVRFTRHFALMR